MGIGHLYNNYVSDVTSYGNLARGKARVIIENSFFENSNDPVKISDEAKLYVSGLEFSECHGSTSGNVTTPPYDLESYYSYSLDSTDQVKNLVTAYAGPIEGMGEWYLDPTGTDGRWRITPEASTLEVTPGVYGTRVIRTVFPGRYSVIIATPNGRTVDEFNCKGASLVRRSLHGRGIYIFSIIDDKNGNAVRSVLIPYR